MNKILLALDAADLNMNAVDFACYLGRLTHSPVIGAFLEYGITGSKRNKVTPETITRLSQREFMELQETTMGDIYAEDNIRLFKQACEKRAVKPFVHRDRNLPIMELVEESRYADMMVIDPATSFSVSEEEVPSSFIKKVLHQAECPVILTPGSFDGLDEVVFAYNGSASCMFAIKQFTYLFPELRNHKATLLQVAEGSEKAVIKKHQVNEWLKLHYNNLFFSMLEGDSNTALFDYCLRVRNKFVVMGAYGRTDISNFMQHSHADIVMRTTNTPMFISHH